MRRKEFIFRISNFFVRLSIDLSIFRSILVDFSEPGRFLTKIRIQGFSRSLNRMAMLVFLEDRYLGSNRSIWLLWSDRFWSTFWNLVDFWRNFGYGGFRGRCIAWRCSYFLKINICGRIELRECWGHSSPNDKYEFYARAKTRHSPPQDLGGESYTYTVNTCINRQYVY